MASPIPGKDWVSMMEKVYLLHPSYVGRQGDPRYMAGVTFLNMCWYVLSFRYILGVISIELGLSVGNFFVVFGVAGQIISVAAALYVGLLAYFRSRFLNEKELAFVSDVVAYDDSNNQRTVLTGEYRLRATKWLGRAVAVVRMAAIAMSINMFVSHVVMGIVCPIMVLGWTLYNILFWTLTTIPLLGMSYYFGTDWVYIFGSWFIGKCHLDMQADYMIDQMNLMIRSPAEVDVYPVYLLDKELKSLIKRVQKFDALSMDLISPYRQTSSYIVCIAMVACTKTDNIPLTAAIGAIAASFFLVSLIFVYSACSMSNKRKEMYERSNEIFVRAARERTSITSNLILRRLVKSVGSSSQPTLSLRDKSGQEYESWEFLEFLLETVSNFFLIVSLYNDYVK